MYAAGASLQVTLEMHDLGCRNDICLGLRHGSVM